MKAVFSFILFAALSGLPLSAQDLLDKLADESCDCISKQDVDNMSKEQMQMQLSLCMMEAVGKYPEAFQKEFGNLNPSDQAAMNKFAEQIGMKMAFKCPAVLMKVADVQTQAQAAPAATLQVLTGTIKAIDGEEFATVTLTDEQGRAHKLLWLRYFKGSERFVSEPSKVIGSKVQVKVESVEYYSPKAKDYYGRKEIREVAFLK
ncbi:MAG: hypothetical protein J5I98_33955 [Phaeodactylibacter sp.]|nr:hypothetical protein [Phaeodactylibacter sp.]